MKMIEKYEKCAGTDVQGDCKKNAINAFLLSRTG